MSIHLQEVSVRLGDVDALCELSIAVDARTVAVIGENGSGKSTFARLVGGLVRHTSGTLQILGFDPAAQAAQLQRRIAMVFSNPDAQILMPTVAEDVAFSLRAERLPAAMARERVAVALDRFGLTELADRSAHDLSGGQKQLLALCGAFVREPDLIVADEPTAYLDARNARRVADHLLADTGHRLVLVTHDLELARRCDTALLFGGGRLVASGDPATVTAQYEEALR
ncbi:energy-coupling factor ABC transporter ATP-binding protein [Planctomonas sp. JC2975]|uniref:energy-coupling factor ABC transporter ATP-binding protein n=1 Tax=Planctomonas sp. JC2975 TaxID=2729626 RepID=UPI0014760218|nr:energy-coupling factor ABC transporter ATP-binding protein [Planctomonas sp. JC2975]NNC13810.1 energy-coupling factor ABC transporter ATP-binding protein [Planctomonas sp. JC2975]